MPGMLKLKYWTNSNSHTKCYTTKVLFIWFSYSLFLLSSLTSFRSNRFRVKSHQFSAAYLWRVTDYRFTRGHLVIYSLSICYRNLTNFLTINRIRLSTLYRVFHIEMFLLKWLWLIEICKLDHQKSKFSLIYGTFSVGGCWGQPILLFQKLVNETQIL